MHTPTHTHTNTSFPQLNFECWKVFIRKFRNFDLWNANEINGIMCRKCLVKHSQNRISYNSFRIAIGGICIFHSINYRWICPDVWKTLEWLEIKQTHSFANIFGKLLQIIIERIQLFVRLRLIYLKTIRHDKQLLPMTPKPISIVFGNDQNLL